MIQTQETYFVTAKTPRKANRAIVIVLVVMLLVVSIFGVWWVTKPSLSGNHFTSGDLENVRSRATYNKAPARDQFDANNIVVAFKDSDYREGDALIAKTVDVDALVANSIAGTGQDISANRQGFRLATTEADRAKVANAISRWQQAPGVAFVGKNYQYSTSWVTNANTATPSDWNDNENWYLKKGNVPQMFKDQNCPNGNACGGGKDVVVAVLDTGLAYENFDDTLGFSGGKFIKSPEYDGINLYKNPGEITGDNLDNDCNGLVDDVVGADAYAFSVAVSYFQQNTCPNGKPTVVADVYRKAGHPDDTNGHGSFVTGQIASEVENGKGVAPAFNLTILPISIGPSDVNSPYFGGGSFDTASAANSIYLAVTKYKVDVINLSWGGPMDDPIIRNNIAAAINKGIVVVAASGNESTTNATYPASYDGVIGVGSTNANDTLSYYSNTGSNVKVTAYLGDQQGIGKEGYQNTLNCFQDDRCTAATIDDGTSYQLAMGTSFASPQVAALAGLIKSKYPTASVDEIKDAIYRYSKDIGPAGFDTSFGYGVIDFQKSLTSPLHSTVYRFFSPTYNKHFYTISATERDNLIAKNPNWKYEGKAYTAFKEANKPNGSLPVYRFYSDKYTAHFFTINQVEMEATKNNPEWKFEGVSYYAYKNQADAAGAIPLYRFWRINGGGHFFTAKESEKNTLLAQPSQWRFEGPAYYVKEFLK